MRAYARKLGQDEEKWGVTGLIHDFDYEQHPTPEEHPAWGAKFLEEHGWPEDIVYAVKSHGDRLGLPRKSLMDKALYAVDELTGLIVAVALVRPSKSIMDVKIKSIKDNKKDKERPPDQRIGGKCPLELAGYEVHKLPIAQICRGQLLGWPTEAWKEIVPNV